MKSLATMPVPHQKLPDYAPYETRDNLMSQYTGDNIGGSGKRATCVRLLIVDDQPRVRRSLEVLLIALRWSKAGTPIPIVIVGKANNGQQAVAQVQALRPDVVVLDLPFHDPANPALTSGPALNGLVAIRTIKQQWPDVRIVVLTMYATDRAAILMAGADVFLLKGCPTSELLDAVSSGLAGGQT